MFWIYDKLLQDNVAEDIHNRINKLSWKYNYFSARKSECAVQPHWNIQCGSTKNKIINNNYEYLLPILKEAKLKFHIPVKLKRVYMNAHTFGVEPHLHTDDGDYTFIYYPRLDWKPEWLGGTALWDTEKENINKYCNYIGNRLLIFKTHIKHQAMPVSRFCYELRSVIVFKMVNDNDTD